MEAVYSSNSSNTSQVCDENIFHVGSVVEWSEFLDTDPEVPDSIPGAYRFSEKTVGLERCPLSLLRTTEELLGRKK
jgi:hypothetical protein